MKDRIALSLMAGTALFLAAAGPSMADDVAPDMGGRPSVDQVPDSRTPETLPASRQHSAPTGAGLAKPADPNRQAQGPGSAPTAPGAGEAATNALPNGQSGGGIDAFAGRPVEARPPDEGPAKQNLNEAQTIVGTRGGGALAANQEYVEKLKEYEVRDLDGKNAGSVEEVLVDVSQGQAVALRMVSGGIAGIGGESYDIAWQQIETLDRNDRVVQLKIPLSGLQADPQAGSRPVPGGGGETAQVAAGDLEDMTVVGSDGQELGEVGGVVLDIATGSLQTLLIQREGTAGAGEVVLDVPWDQVAKADPGGERMELKITQQALQPNPEFGNEQTAGQD